MREKAHPRDGGAGERRAGPNPRASRGALLARHGNAGDPRAKPGRGVSVATGAPLGAIVPVNGEPHSGLSSAAPLPSVPAPSIEIAVPPPQAASRASAGAAAAQRRTGLGRAQLLDLYYYMRLTRCVEERLVRLYRQGKVVGGLYRSLGQEATAVGSAYALEKGDLLAPLIRDLGAVLVRGYTPRDCFSQYLARATSPTLGRDGVLHMGEVGGRGVLGGMGVLGSLIPVLAGCGLAFRAAKTDRVCLGFIGDGGTSTTGFHEGLNLAAARRLPLVVVVENNGYAYSTPVSKQTNQPEFSAKGAAYGCPGVKVDGNDVLAVHAAVRGAVLRARAGEGPSLIEARTFRMKGHAEHDDASYVPAHELEEWRKRDPLDRYRGWLVTEAVASRRDLDAIEAGIESRLDSDLAWAERSPFPVGGSALAGVYGADSPFRPPAYPDDAEEAP